MLTRISDGALIETSQITLSLDWDSWCWKFSAEVVGRDSLDLVSPARNGGPVECEVNINGHRWYVIVEEWNEQLSFNRRSYTVQGRSNAAMLDEPYMLPQIYRNDSAAITARQQVEAILRPYGWTVQWEIDDWLIAQDALSIEATPIKAVAEIARTVGGCLFDKDSAKIAIRKRCPYKSWHWAGSTPNVSIPESVLLSLSGQYIPALDVNGIYIAGTGPGARGVLVKLAGTAGDKLLPGVQGDLFTDEVACIARGIYELSMHVTPMVRRTVTMPLFQAGSNIGLLVPGDFVEITVSGQPEKGVIAGTSVTAAVQGDGAVAAWQAVEIFVAV